MNRMIAYVIIWELLVGATMLQVGIAVSSIATIMKQTTIILLAFIEAITAAAYFQNLRHETRVLSLLPIGALTVVSTLVIVSIAGGL